MNGRILRKNYICCDTCKIKNGEYLLSCGCIFCEYDYRELTENLTIFSDCCFNCGEKFINENIINLNQSNIIKQITKPQKFIKNKEVIAKINKIFDKKYINNLINQLKKVIQEKEKIFQRPFQTPFKNNEKINKTNINHVTKSYITKKRNHNDFLKESAEFDKKFYSCRKIP